MPQVFLGSEAVASGELTRSELRRFYQPIFRDVYIPKRTPRTLFVSTKGAWLWSRRRAVISGRAAAALHGDEYVDASTPIELIWNNNHAPSGLIVRNETLSSGEITQVMGMPVTTPARTAFDLARYLPRRHAIAHVDAVCRETHTADAEILSVLELHKASRYVRRAREVIKQIDAGAQSPMESWVRVLICDAGLPPPETQVCVTARDFRAYVDMGWIKGKVAVEYDGDDHRKNRSQYVKDIRRYQRLRELGWLVVIVLKEDKPAEILARVRAALIARGVIPAEKETMPSPTRILRA